MRIFIPTRGRVQKQLTMKWLSPEAQRQFRCTLICAQGEVPALQELYPHSFVMASPIEGMAEKRQWIVESFPGEDKALMLDDDLNSWSKRDQEGRYKKCTTDNVHDALEDVEDLLDEYNHGSIGYRLFANNRPAFKEGGRNLRALAYNLNVLREGRHKFDMMAMSDFDMQLKLMQAGHQSFQYNQVVQEHASSSSEGGCSYYRTTQVIADAAHELQRRYPDLVTVVQKQQKSKGAVGADWGNRTDVRVKWSKAYNG